MSDPMILKIIDSGADAWHEWRKEHPENIDLTNADLSNRSLVGIHFQSVNLSGANFSGSDLSKSKFHRSQLRGAILTGANLERSLFAEVNLSDANISGAKLTDASLNEVNFSGTDLSGADLSYAKLSYAGFHNANLCAVLLKYAGFRDSKLIDTNLSKADLSRAILTHTDLSGANLSGTDLSDAKFSDVVMISRQELDMVAFPITVDQLSGIIFEDEINQAKERRENQGNEQKDGGSRLVVRLDAPGITPFNFSMLLVAIEATYNNIFYLLNTDENSLVVIERHLRPYYQGMEAKNALQISMIREGSIEVSFESLGKGVKQILSVLTETSINILKQIREFREQKHRHEQEVLDKEIERKKTKVETEGIILKNEEQRLRNEALERENKSLDLVLINESAETAKNLVNLTPSEKGLTSVLLNNENLGLCKMLQNSDNQVVATSSLELQKQGMTTLTSAFTKFIQYGYTIDVKYLESQNEIDTD